MNSGTFWGNILVAYEYYWRKVLSSVFGYEFPIESGNSTPTASPASPDGSLIQVSSTIQYWNRLAGSFEEHFFGIWCGIHARALTLSTWPPTRHPFSSTREASSLVLMDYGAGTGGVTLGVVGYAKDMIAYDPAEQMLEQLNARVTGLPPDLRHIISVLSSLATFPLGTVDLLYAHLSVIFAENLPQSLREIYDLLKPGGVAVITGWSRLELNPVHVWVFEALNAVREVKLPLNSEELQLLPNHNFEICDHASTTALLQSVGFSEVSVITQRLPFDFSQLASPGYSGGLDQDDQLMVWAIDAVVRSFPIPEEKSSELKDILAQSWQRRGAHSTPPSSWFHTSVEVYVAQK